MFYPKNNCHRNEVKVFKMCMEWAARSCHISGLDTTAAEMREQLGECFNLIRFDRMTPSQFVNCLRMNGDIFQDIKHYAIKVKDTIEETVALINSATLHSLRQLSIKMPSNVSITNLFDDKLTTDMTFILMDGGGEEVGKFEAHYFVVAPKSKSKPHRLMFLSSSFV